MNFGISTDLKNHKARDYRTFFSGSGSGGGASVSAGFSPSVPSPSTSSGGGGGGGGGVYILSPFYVKTTIYRLKVFTNYTLILDHSSSTV